MSAPGTLAITEPGSRISYRNDQILVTRGDAEARRVRLTSLVRILVYGPSEVTSGAVGACLRNGIDVVFLTGSGRYRGRLTGHRGRNGPLRLAQYRAALDPARSLSIAKTMVEGKIRNQRNFLIRAQRRIKNEAVAGALAAMRLLVPALREAPSHDSLRGYEGQASALYFGVFGRAISNADFTFVKRTRRPPRDPVNACLSFAYAVLTSEVESAVLASGLDPLIGFLHNPAYGRPSMALDLVEEFRPVLVDRLVLRLVNWRRVSPADFGDPQPPEPDESSEDEVDLGIPETGASDESAAADPRPAVHLTRTGRAVLLSSYHRGMREKVFYEPAGCRLDYRQVILRQCYAMARAIEDGASEYHPFGAR